MFSVAHSWGWNSHEKESFEISFYGSEIIGSGLHRCKQRFYNKKSRVYLSSEKQL